MEQSPGKGEATQAPVPKPMSFQNPLASRRTTAGHWPEALPRNPHAFRRDRQRPRTSRTLRWRTWMAGNQGEVDSKRKSSKRERLQRIASVYDEFAAERFADIARKNAYRQGFLAGANSLDLESLHREI
ncbi:MAG TPA: hypothetical protein PKL61_14625, partial [Accumulibacter sp.]